MNRRRVNAIRRVCPRGLYSGEAEDIARRMHPPNGEFPEWSDPPQTRGEAATETNIRGFPAGQDVVTIVITRREPAK